MCQEESVYVGGVGCWSHLSMVIKARAVVTKLNPYAWLLSAASILRERQTYYSTASGERKKGRKARGKREGKKERTGGWGFEACG